MVDPAYNPSHVRGIHWRIVVQGWPWGKSKTKKLKQKRKGPEFKHQYLHTYTHTHTHTNIYEVKETRIVKIIL
jgi:hypothetical protein